jgi:hypothetical protein
MSVADVVGNCVYILVIVPLCADLSEVPNGVPVYVPIEWDIVLVDIVALEFEPLNYDYVI